MCIRDSGEFATAIKLAIVVIVVLAGVDLLEDYLLKISNGMNSQYKKWRHPEE